MEKPSSIFLRGNQFLCFLFPLFASAGLLLCPDAANAQLQAAFSADQTMGCGQLPVQFTDESTGNPSQWTWDFGNGTESHLQNPATTFTTAGTFPVTLTVSDGVNYNSHTSYITVYEPPRVKFSADPVSGCYPLTTQFTDQSTAGTGNISKWTWDFGDGSPFGTEQNPVHIYDSAGTFVAKLTVTNDAGCTTSASNTKIVTNEGVVVNFSADKTFSCGAPLTVNFTSSTTSAQTIDYVWNFGDGGTSSGQTATHTYTQKGNFTVTLTASVGSGGCQDVVTKTEYIHVGSYTSDFTVPQGCANTPLSFKNASVPLPVSATWSFGDGTTATGVNATHQFKKAGTYEVTLINDFGGCKDSVKKSITTYPSPVADFKSDMLNYCGVPASVAFQNLSQGAATWKWKFGDGDSSAAQEPAHTYRKGGVYTVSLLAVSQNGCTDSVSKPDYITVDAPDIRFNATDGFGCIPLTTTFSIPAASAADIASYAWDFGDGSAVNTQASPSHQYTGSGNFTVTLDVVTKTGCKFSFARANYIRTGTRAKVDFKADPLTTCLDQKVQFTNLSQPPGVAWTWVFPNDKSSDTAENPLHQFSELGPQDVTLIVNDNGCVDSLTKQAYVQVNLPKAQFTQALVSCQDPYTFAFTDKSKGAASYEWDFGDGSPILTDKNPTHKFSSTGPKRVVLTVTNGSCKSMDTGYLQVVDEHPVITASPGTVCHGDSVTLSLGSVDFPQFVDSITWSDGAGNSVSFNTGTGALPPGVFAYKANGNYTPSILLDYVNNCRATVQGTAVHVQGPVSAYTTSTNEVCQGNVVTFTDASQGDPPGTAIQRWIWTYGDGNADTTTTGSSVHTYLNNGHFNTRLKITDANGCSDVSAAAAHSLIVNPSKADFSSPDTLVCPGTPVSWVNNSLGGTGNTYLWNFGDGNTSTEGHPPAMTYPLVDSAYTVSLKVTTAKGCSDSLVRPQYIHIGEPHAIMKNPGDIKICRILEDTAISLSQNYRSVFWDFGDGFTSTLDTAYHIYNIPGTYIQRLIVQGYSPGCADTVERTVVIAGPIGTPLVDNSSGCFPLKVNFSAKNVLRAVSYQWFFGDGSSSAPSTQSQASYTYKNEGIFHPTLKLTDDTGCFVIVPITDSLTVIVDSIGVVPTFSWPNQCDSNQVRFTAEGSIFSEEQLGSSPTYHWDFGDPTTIDDVVPGKDTAWRYGSSGTYEATLTVSTKYGCKQTMPLTVKIPDSAALSVSATSDPAEICQGDAIQLHATSNIGERYEWSPATGMDNPASPDPVVTPLASTTYLVTAFSKGNCQTDSQEVNVVVHNLPEIDAGPDITTTTGSVITLQPTGSADITSWKWTPPDYLNCTACANPTSTPRGNISYVVQVANSSGCLSSDTLSVNLVCDEGKVFIPNTFTPNNDGNNDLFYPRGLGVKKVLYFRIYNRFGQLVYEHTNFQLNDQASGWDGTMKGQRLNPDVFVYTAQMVCDNDKIFKLSGNVTLIR